MAKRFSSLRNQILVFVGALIVLCVLGSTISLFRITEIHRSLDAVNRISVPLGRLLTQLRADSEVYEREADRRLGFAHWRDVHWKPKPIPSWVEDVVRNEMGRAEKLIDTPLPWASQETRQEWIHWIEDLQARFEALQKDGAALHRALVEGNHDLAQQLHPHWVDKREQWVRLVQWGATEFDRSLRQGFSHAQEQTSELRTALEVLLGVVVALSLLVLWLGERALRPLAELTQWARAITQRGLRREDKALLPETAPHRDDEVSALAREFHRMATTLLEREKVVESQKDHLEESNRLLREMGELNLNILNSIKSVLLVTDQGGRITQCNPRACEFLGADPMAIRGTLLLSWPCLDAFQGRDQWLKAATESRQLLKIEAVQVNGKTFGGSVMPLWKDDGGAYGAIFVIEDLTEEISLQDRLRHAENLAAIGRLSAQVAHEVRNPLHSIGLETEIAAELASKLENVSLKNSLESILFGVERLEKITDNYLKLSRISKGKRVVADLGEVLETVLATYAQTCQSLKIKVDWSREGGGQYCWMGDPDTVEQALGNLFRNAIQALESSQVKEPEITWKLGSAESGRLWLKIQDNGPGISPEMETRIFTPFETDKAQGTGLGLSFAKKVIEDQGGTLEYMRADESKGAAFLIQIPALNAESEDHWTSTPTLEMEVTHGESPISG